LVLHSRGGIAFLDETCVVDNQHSFSFSELAVDVLLKVVPDRTGVPAVPRQEVLQAVRGGVAGHLAEPAWKLLLKRLPAESPEFREAGERHEVVSHRAKRKEFLNRYVGRIRVDHTDLWLGPEAGPCVVTYAPADEELRQRPERLHTIALERAAGAGPAPASARRA
jgi:hypothetical protein